MLVSCVLDTNVIISGIISKGTPSEVLKLWEEKQFSLFVSKEITEEFLDVLKRSYIAKFLGKNQENKIELFRNNLKKYAKTINPKKKFDLVKDDPDDNKFLDCAYVAKADFIVTGDKHLLKLGDFFDTKIITPKKFLEWVRCCKIKSVV